MSKIFKIILLALLLPSLAFAQNEGDPVNLGTGASKVFCAGADGNWRFPSCSTSGGLTADTVVRGTFTHTQPTITTANSFACLAANTSRRGFLVENNSAANIMINVNNGTLTGIVPTSTNLGIVLTPGSSYHTPPNASPTAIVRCYQTSGGDINTVSFVEF